LSILPLVGVALVGIVIGWLFMLLTRPFDRKSRNTSIRSWLYIMTMSMAVLSQSLVKQGLLGLIVSSLGLIFGALIFFALKNFITNFR
jgi:hypothetical protein